MIKLKHCGACNVDIENKTNRCPLCYSVISVIDDKESSYYYPNITLHEEEYNLFLKILVFASIVSMAASITVDLLTTSKYSWSIVVVASICYMWVSVSTAITKHKKIGFNLMMQSISLSVLVVILGVIFDFSYFVYNYVLPALFISAMLSFDVIVIIKYRDIKNYVLYSLIVSLFGFIPLILYAVGLVQVVWPMAASGVFSVLSIIAMFVFAYKTTTSELKRRFHI